MRHASLTLMAIVALACNSHDVTAPRVVPESSLGKGQSAVGAVYTLSNAASGNEVVVFDRGADGSLTAAGAFATGGLGNGAGLGSQGAVVLNHQGNRLFAVNAGDNTISSFRVLVDNSLELVSTVSSGGTMPISLTVSGDLLYVLNAGGSNNITGFTVAHDGALAPLAGSTAPLSAPAAGGAQVEFSPDGRFLVVTEKATNSMSVYTAAKSGIASGPTVFPSSGATPFGFAFRRDLIVVSEAFGGAPDASAASSYTLGRDGALHLVSGTVPTTETAACWFVITADGRFAYTTNTGSGSITGYAVSPRGDLTILDADGRTGITGAGTTPIDLALSRNSRFLYSLNSGADAISAFEVNANGSLSSLSTTTGLPASSVGLAAR